MAWDGSPHAGFSIVEPWLPLHVDWPARNVETEAANPNSMLNHYRSLLQLRRTNPALSIGSIDLIDTDSDVLAYLRSHGDRRMLVALNLSAQARSIPSPAGELILSTIETGEFDGSLRANEGVILRLEG